MRNRSGTLFCLLWMIEVLHDLICRVSSGTMVGFIMLAVVMEIKTEK